MGQAGCQPGRELFPAKWHGKRRPLRVLHPRQLWAVLPLLPLPPGPRVQLHSAERLEEEEADLRKGPRSSLSPEAGCLQRRFGTARGPPHRSPPEVCTGRACDRLDETFLWQASSETHGTSGVPAATRHWPAVPRGAGRMRVGAPPQDEAQGWARPRTSRKAGTVQAGGPQKGELRAHHL